MEELRRQVHSIGRRRAWVIWGVGLSVYLLAVFFRTSLGVAGLLAAERFHINAAQLATFTVLQLAVYAGMQVPVGILLDRHGSKALMVTGLALMTVGQLSFAFAASFPVGIACRVLIGAGDAMIFTSLLRIVALWFRVKQAPLVTQLTGMVGQLGAVAAATPLALALRQLGWTPAFAISGGLGVVLMVPLLLIVRNSPYAGTSVEKVKLRVLATTLREVWGNPGTRVGLWTHFTCQFSATVFTMLWGYPFLVKGEGLSSAAAANLLMLMTGTALVAGPLIAKVTAGRPYHRTTVALSIVAAIVTMWAVTLLWPGPAPLPLLVVLCIVMAVGGPGSMIGFDLVRSFHLPHRLGRATGFVNVGGFVASLVTMGLIGVVLDLRAPGGQDDYSLSDFRVALSVQFLVWGVGIVQLVRYRRKGRRLVQETPGAMAALAAGDALLPGLSVELEDIGVVEEGETPKDEADDLPPSHRH